MKICPKAQGWGLCFNIKHREIRLIFLLCWKGDYSSDLLSPVLQTPLCCARDAWTGKVSTGRARVCFVWRLSVRSVRVWLIFLTRSLKCLGEHFNVNNVFCHFYNIFCLFAVSYQFLRTEMPGRQYSQNGADSAKLIIFSKRFKMGFVQCKYRAIFHSRLAEIVKKCA